jgi:hypothetical protein
MVSDKEEEKKSKMNTCLTKKVETLKSGEQGMLAALTVEDQLLGPPVMSSLRYSDVNGPE